MATLLQVYQLITQHGDVELNQLSRQLQTSPALIQAMLEQLERMNKIERANAAENDCVSTACQQCETGKQRCVRPIWYRLTENG